jgi:Ca2+-binding EF-hand superfamily protein
LKKETGFSHGEITDLYRQFRVDSKDLYMTVEQLNELYKGVFPHGHPEKFAERVFSTFDKRGKGKVDFHGFLNILSIQLKGNVKTKYEWVFEVIDYKKTGNASRDDIFQVITVSS